jgi:hypothetical protein
METKGLFSALVKAQVELKNPPKNKEGYGYKYATLDSIIEQTKPILQKYGLCVVQTLTGDGIKVGVNTLLVHESGESISETLWLPATDMKGVNAVQAIGASITYGRRYAISAILGISADDDTDATVSENNQKQGNYTTQTKKIENRATVQLTEPNHTTIAFGKLQGKQWSDPIVSINDLNFYQSYYERALISNPNSKFTASNKAVLEIVKAEIAKRGVE